MGFFAEEKHSFISPPSRDVNPCLNPLTPFIMTTQCLWILVSVSRHTRILYSPVISSTRRRYGHGGNELHAGSWQPLTGNTWLFAADNAQCACQSGRVLFLYPPPGGCPPAPFSKQPHSPYHHLCPNLTLLIKWYYYSWGFLITYSSITHSLSVKMMKTTLAFAECYNDVRVLCS